MEDIEEYIISKFENNSNLFPSLEKKEVDSKKYIPKTLTSADSYLCSFSFSDLQNSGINIKQVTSIKKEAILFCKYNILHVTNSLYYRLQNSPDLVFDVEVFVIGIEFLQNDKIKKLFNFPNDVFDFPKVKLYCPSKTIETTFKNQGFLQLPELNLPCYCINIHRDYFSQNLQKWREIYYSFKDKTWKSGYKTVSELQSLIKDISKNGFKHPLCFSITGQGQLVSLGCNTRIMLAKYLGMEYIPAIICLNYLGENIQSELFVTEKKDEKALAEYYLSPYIVFNV